MEITGGPAMPVVVVNDTKVEGIHARPVYGYITMPTDRPVKGGKARRVKVITAADLQQNGGIYTLIGGPYAIPVYTDPSGETDGGVAIAVYPVNAWPPWYLTDGITSADVLAAHQSIGAASYAASKLNLNNPGTNDIPGPNAGDDDPTWDAVNGWTFNGIDQSLLTAIKALPVGTMIVRFSDATLGRRVSGATSADGNVQWTISPYTDVVFPAVYYGAAEGFAYYAPASTSGTLGISGNLCYRNGILDGETDGHTPHDNGNRPDFVIAIGCENHGGNSWLYFQGSVQAWVYYSKNLTAPQMLDVMTKVAAL